MNRLFFITTAAMLCPAMAQQEVSPVQRLETAKLEYDALLAVSAVRYHLMEIKEGLNVEQVDRELFMQGFREQLAGGNGFNASRVLTYYQEQMDYVIQQIQAADFLTPHAAQSGVTCLENGLQYDCFILPDENLNYKARRAHLLMGSIPGTRYNVPISGTPEAVDEALYEAPRGVAWRFIMPASLLDAADAEPLLKKNIHTVEILAMRESSDEEQIQQARAYFAAKSPHLPTITHESPELFAERSILCGMDAARVIDEPSPQLHARIEELLPMLMNADDEQFSQLMDKASTAYWEAREELRRMQHRRIAADIMLIQQQQPGTIKLSNGILCRAHGNEKNNIPFLQARFIEEEELGPEMYLRVRDRIINAQNDLPELLLDVADEIPPGNRWELIIPPALRGEGYELPLIYRIRATRPTKKNTAPNPAPDVI